MGPRTHALCWFMTETQATLITPDGREWRVMQPLRLKPVDDSPIPPHTPRQLTTFTLVRLHPAV